MKHFCTLALLAGLFVGAHVKAAGDLDPDFNRPAIDQDVVISILLQPQPDGSSKAIVGGGFHKINQMATGPVARLNADGTLDSSFNNAGAGIHPGDGNRLDSPALAFDGSGNILIGGATYNPNVGLTNFYVQRANLDGVVDSSFSALPNGTVTGIAVSPTDGSVFIVGTFTEVNGSTVNPGLAKLSATGALDTVFAQNVPTSVNGQPFFFNPARDVRVVATGDLANPYKIYVVGTAQLNGAGGGCVIRLNADGTQDTSFNLIYTDTGRFDGFDLTGNTLTVVGNFTAPENYIAQYNATNGATLTTTFDTATLGSTSLYKVLTGADGKLYALTNFGSTAIVSFNADGSANTDFAAEVSGSPYAIAQQADGKIIIAGELDVSGAFNIGVARLLLTAAPPVGGGSLAHTVFMVNGSDAPGELHPSMTPVAITSGSSINFFARQPTAAVGLTVKVQSSSTPTIPSSWADLPGGQLTNNGGGAFQLVTTTYPTDPEIFFRAVASAPTYLDSISPFVGPFNVSVGTTVVTGLAVPGKANIWLAGKPAGASAAGGDYAPAQSPVEVTGIAFDINQSLNFAVTGATGNGVVASTSADGDSSFANHAAENGINALVAPTNALVGVFLDDAGVASRGSIFDYSDSSFPGGLTGAGVRAKVGVPFFIGDGRGLAGNFPAPLNVYPPAGATHLYLGSLDQAGNNDNTGQFDVTVSNGAFHQSDISFSQTADREIALRGDVITYTLTLSNNTSQGIYSVTVSDTIPAYSTLADSENFQVHGTTLVWNGRLDPGIGNVVHLQFKLRVDASAPLNGSFLDNDTVTIYSENYGLITPQKSSPRIAIKAPLDLVASSDAFSVAPGGTVTFTVQVTNITTDKVKDAVVTIPAVDTDYYHFVGASYTIFSAAGVPLGAAIPVKQTSNGSVYNLGKLKPGQYAIITLRIAVAYDAPPDTPIVLPPTLTQLTDVTGNLLASTPAVSTPLSGVPPADPPHFSLVKFVPDGSTVLQLLALSPKVAGYFSTLLPDLTTEDSIKTFGKTINPTVVDSFDDNGFFQQGVLAPGQPGGPASSKITFALLFGNDGGITASNTVVFDQIPIGTRYVAGSASLNGITVDDSIVVDPDGHTLHFPIGDVGPDKPAKAGKPAKPSIRLILYTVKVLDNSSGGPSLGSPVISTGGSIASTSLVSTTYAEPEEIDLTLLAPGAAYLESYKGTPVAKIGGTAPYDLYYRNTGGVTPDDFQIIDPTPMGTRFRSVDFLNKDHTVRPPAAGETFGFDGTSVTIHLGPVKPGKDGFVRVTYDVDDSAMSTPGLQIVNEPFVPADAFPSNPSRKTRGPQTRDIQLKVPIAGARSTSTVLFSDAYLISQQIKQRPRLFVGLQLPESVQAGHNFDVLVFVGNPTDGYAFGPAVEVGIPDGATFVSASQDNAVTFEDHGENVVALPNVNSNGSIRYDVKPHSSNISRVTFRANDDAGGRMISSSGAHTFSTKGQIASDGSVVDIASVYSGRMGTYVCDSNHTFNNSKSQIVSGQLGLNGPSGVALGSDQFKKKVAALGVSTLASTVGGADTIGFNNNSNLVPLGNDRYLAFGPRANIVAQGGGNLIGQDGNGLIGQDGNGLIGQDGNGLIGQDGNGIVAQGGGNLIALANLIGQDGNGLIGQDGNGFHDILAGIVAQGGGNLIAKGGNIFNAGGLNLISQDGNNVISNDGGTFSQITTGLAASIVAAGQGGIVAQGGGNLIGQDGNGIVAQGGGNVLATRANALINVGGGSLLSGLIPSADNAVGLQLGSTGGILGVTGGSAASIIGNAGGGFRGQAPKPAPAY